MRKEVAVGLVLHLAHRRIGGPQVRGAAQEADRIGCEIELGVGGDPPGGLQERYDERAERGDGDAPLRQGPVEGGIADPCRVGPIDRGGQVRPEGQLSAPASPRVP
ncbi:hypothetical protein GCM10022238_19350 [Gordonia hankookensis]